MKMTDTVKLLCLHQQILALEYLACFTASFQFDLCYTILVFRLIQKRIIYLFYYFIIPPSNICIIFWFVYLYLITQRLCRITRSSLHGILFPLTRNVRILDT